MHTRRVVTDGLFITVILGWDVDIRANAFMSLDGAYSE